MTGDAAFHTTRWSLIASARDPRQPTARESLAVLCKMYWYPLYVFVRRRGSDAETSADLIQGFFVELLEGDLLNLVDREKGKFRSYLLGALKHFISNEWHRAHTQKRGGRTPVVSLEGAEERYGLEPSHQLSPEHLYERRWALTLLEQANEQLRQQYEEAGKGQQFTELRDLIAGPLADRSYAEIGQKLGMSEDAIKTAVHRLRKQYRQILKARIADTLESTSEIDEELRHLYSAVSIVG